MFLIDIIYSKSKRMRTNSNKNTIKIIDLKILKDLFCLQIDIIDY